MQRNHTSLPLPPTARELELVRAGLDNAARQLAAVANNAADGEIVRAFEHVARWLELVLQPLVERPELLHRLALEATKSVLLERIGESAQAHPIFRGLCTECGSALQHFHGPNAGGVLCPQCDGEYVAELRELNTQEGSRCAECGAVLVWLTSAEPRKRGLSVPRCPQCDGAPNV